MSLRFKLVICIFSPLLLALIPSMLPIPSYLLSTSTQAQTSQDRKIEADKLLQQGKQQSHTPLIRWNQVSGVTEYIVEVTGPTGSMWKTKTQQTQLVYAGKSLVAGVPYSIIIHTNTGKSSQEDNDQQQQKTTNLEFRILRQSEVEMIKLQTAKISPNNEADALTLADLYSNYVIPESTIQAYKLPNNTFQTYSLSGEAIAILESLLQQGKQSTLIYRTLGDLYWQTGLIYLAQVNYLRAIDFVQGLEDMEDWTKAQYSLGKVYYATDNHKQALEHFNQAIIGYIFLGNKGRADVIQRQIRTYIQRE